MELSDVRGLRPMPEHVRRGLYKTPKGGFGLKAAYRLMWFREDHPEWAIETQAIAAEADFAFFRAVVKDVDGRIVATSHKSVKAVDFPGGHIEKAETGAVARALELLGYGTEFGEFDEADVAETAQPSSRRTGASTRSAPTTAPRPSQPAVANGSRDAITDPQKGGGFNREQPILDTQRQAIANLHRERGQAAPEMEGWTEGQAADYLSGLQKRRAA